MHRGNKATVRTRIGGGGKGRLQGVSLTISPAYSETFIITQAIHMAYTGHVQHNEQLLWAGIIHVH